MELWEWFRQERAKAVKSASIKHIAMVNHVVLGNRLMQSQNTGLAYSEYLAGLQVAQELNEPCWELFFHYWLLETRTYFEWNIKDALEIGIRASTLAYKAAYRDCAVRPQLFLTVAEVYSFMDAVGYKAEIDTLIDYILREVPPNEDGKRRIQYMQACVAFEHDNLLEAENIIADYMGHLHQNPFRETFYHSLMRRICFARGDIPRAFDFAQRAVHCAKTSSLANPEGWNRSWAAALAQRLGNERLALELYDAAIAFHEAKTLAKSFEYYDAISDYHEQRGAIDAALHIREEQAVAQERIGSIQYQCLGALQRARLLGRMGRDIQPSLSQADELAHQLKQPSLYLAKLKRVELGDYFEYDWQH